MPERRSIEVAKIAFSSIGEPSEIPKGLPLEDAERLAMLVGSTLRRLRAKCELSQQEVAKGAGIDQAHLSRIENRASSHRNIRTSTLIKLIASMNFRFADFVEELTKAYEEVLGGQQEDDHPDSISQV